MNGTFFFVGLAVDGAGGGDGRGGFGLRLGRRLRLRRRGRRRGRPRRGRGRLARISIVPRENRRRTFRLRDVAQYLFVERGGRVLFLTLRRHLGGFVFVFGIACRAAGLLHLLLDHRDDRVVGHAPFAGTVIVHYVTKPKLALLHRLLPRD
jgi:hypothetical protein